MLSLVTGGCGFIGAHVAAHCLSLGHKVVILDDLSGGFEDNLPNGTIFIRGSVTDTKLVDALFREYRFRYVYHLAAYAAEGLSHFIRRFNYQNNVIGSMVLINAAVNAGTVERFVFTSSIAVYGPNQVPMTEDLTPYPEDPYGIAKYAVELDLHAAWRMFGLPFTIFRPHNVYGEKQNLWDRYRNVIGIFMNQLLQDQPMTIFGDGQQTRAFSYIDDVAPIIAQSVNVEEAQNETFNIGADQPYTVLELAKEVARSLGKEPKIVHLPARQEVVHAYASHDKVKKIFKTGTPVSLSEGLRRMADWAKTKPPRPSPAFESIEVLKNLPPSWAKALNTR
jgi:UDP-glucose 4-epimerase